MKRIAKALLLLLLLAMLIWLCGNMLYGKQSLSRREEYWGSFTKADVASSDGKYIARHDAKKLADNNVQMIVVDVYDAKNGEILDSFIPARAMDFHGICWEEGTHNLWIQSGDTGIICYHEQDGEWILDEDAVRPESIVSKSEAEAKKKK